MNGDGDKITFICRDGCITGNRFILTNYSRLLGEALDSYKARLPSSSITGNRPAVYFKNFSTSELGCLFQVLYSLTYAEISNLELTGLQNVARLLDIELTLRNGRNGFIRVKASPVPYRDPINGGVRSIGVISSAAAIAATAAISRPPSPACSSPISNDSINNNNNTNNSTKSNNTRGLNNKNGPVVVRIKKSAIVDKSTSGKDSTSRDPRLESARKRRGDQGPQKNSLLSCDDDEPELELNFIHDNDEEDHNEYENEEEIDEKPIILDSRFSDGDMTGYGAAFAENNPDLVRSHPDINFNDISLDRCNSPSKTRKNGPGGGLYSTKKYYTKTASKDEYTCNLCGHLTNCWTSIKAHIETQHYHLEFQCKKCSYVTVWRAEIVKHIRNFHKSRSSSEDTYITRQRKEFSGEADLNPVPSTEPEEPMETTNPVNGNEIKTEHGEDDPRARWRELLEEDDEDMEDEDDLREPLIEGNNNLSTTSGRPMERLSSRIPDINKDCYEMVRVGNKKMYKCLSCAKECKTYCGIREHQYSTHYGYICICNQCDVKYRSRSNMFKHLNLVHNIVKNFTHHFGYLIEDGHQKIPEIPLDSVDSSGKFKCKICSNNFLDKDIIINHLVYKHRIKSDVSPFYEEVTA